MGTLQTLSLLEIPILLCSSKLFQGRFYSSLEYLFLLMWFSLAKDIFLPSIMRQKFSNRMQGWVLLFKSSSVGWILAARYNCPSWLFVDIHFIIHICANINNEAKIHDNIGNVFLPVVVIYGISIQQTGESASFWYLCWAILKFLCFFPLCLDYT